MVEIIKEEIQHEVNIPARIVLQKLEDKTTVVPPHWHKHIEIDYMLEGESYFVVDGKRMEKRKGDILLINSGMVHSGGAVIPGNYMELITIQWDYDFFEKYSDNLAGCYFSLEADSAVVSKIKDQLRQLADIYSKREQYYEIKVSAILMQIGAELLEYCQIERETLSRAVGSSKVQQIQKAVAYIEKNYKEDISLREVASYVNMEPTYFSKKFKECTGNNYHSYLMSYRLIFARADLLYTDLNVTEIAYKNGFLNVKSLIEKFKHAYQMTPGQYRNYYKH